MRTIICVILAIYAAQAEAQPGWTVLQCMQYAVEHNHEVGRSTISEGQSTPRPTAIPT